MLHVNERDLRARSARCSGEESMPPMAPAARSGGGGTGQRAGEQQGATAAPAQQLSPSAFVVMKERMAVSAVRTPHPACHSSGWCCEMLRQIFLPTSKRPFCVENKNCGGLLGYSLGKIMRPWYLVGEDVVKDKCS